MKFTIGGGDAKRIMKGDLLALWNEKKGLAEPEDIEFKIPVMVGMATEAANLLYYEHRTSRRVFRLDDPALGIDKTVEIADAGRRGIRYTSILFPWMVGHLDGATQDAPGEPFGAIDAKHTSAIANWNTATAVIERNYWQGVHYMNLTGWRFTDWSVFYGNSDWREHRTHWDDAHSAELLGREIAFLKMLESDIPPGGVAEEVATPTAPVVPRARAIVEAEARTLPFANILAVNAPIICSSYAHAKAHARAEKAIKDAVKFPDDARSIDAFGVVVSIDAKGSKSVKPSTKEKAPVGVGADAEERAF